MAALNEFFPPSMPFLEVMGKCLRQQGRAILAVHVLPLVVRPVESKLLFISAGAH